MGRKGDYTEKVKSGPGRKAKKQKPPTFANEHLLKSGEEKKLSSRQKKRAKKERGKKNIKNQEGGDCEIRFAR